MRKIAILLATLGFVVTGALLPVTSAQASAACDTAWHNATSGYFYAYANINCSTQLGRDQGNDANWSDSSGAFQGTDNDRASSILHKGTSGMAVMVYRHANHSGNYACITKSELYVSNLHDNYLTGGTGSYRAWDSISSHKWVAQSDCNGNLLT